MAYVYFIDNDSGLTKIGRTKKDPLTRMSQLPFPHLSMKFFFETDYDSKLETALHKRYSQVAEGREWFNLGEVSITDLQHTCKVLNDGIVAIYQPSYDDNFIPRI